MSRLLPAVPSCLSFYRDERDPNCEECDSESGLACREECDSDDEQHGRCVVVVHHSNVCGPPVPLVHRLSRSLPRLTRQQRPSVRPRLLALAKGVAITDPRDVSRMVRQVINAGVCRRLILGEQERSSDAA